MGANVSGERATTNTKKKENELGKKELFFENLVVLV